VRNRGYGRHGKVQEMIETLGQMRTYGISPSNTTLLLALECLGENCAWEEFEMTFCYLEKSHHENPSPLLSAALRSVKKSCYGVYLLWCLVQERGLNVSNNFYYETLESLLAPFQEEEDASGSRTRGKKSGTNKRERIDKSTTSTSTSEMEGASSALTESPFDRELRSHMVLEILQLKPVSSKIKTYFPRILQCLEYVHDSDKERASRLRDEIHRLLTTPSQ